MWNFEKNRVLGLDQYIGNYQTKWKNSSMDQHQDLSTLKHYQLPWINS